MKKAATVVGVLLLAAVAYVVTRPDTFHVERKVTIAAPAEVVYAQVADFRVWRAWSPWEKLDPSMKRTYEGSSYEWRSDAKEAGAGKMTITETKPPERIAIDLHFIAPFESNAKVTFTFVRKGEGQTEVTWAMDGGGGFGGKVMNAFMDADKTVGGDFDKGLAALKTVSEDEAKKQPSEQAPPAPEAADAGQAVFPGSR